MFDESYVFLQLCRIGLISFPVSALAVCLISTLAMYARIAQLHSQAQDVSGKGYRFQGLMNVFFYLVKIVETN